MCCTAIPLMADLEARRHRSSDTGLAMSLHPAFNEKISKHIPREGKIVPMVPTEDRGMHADPAKRALLSVAKQKDLTESIGTMLENVQLSQMSDQQLDELALLVNERGVVFLRGQDLTTEKQIALFEHYGCLDRHQTQTSQKHLNVHGHNNDHRETLNYTPWPWADFHADSSFEQNPTSYSMLRMEAHPEVGGDTAWVCYKSCLNSLIGHSPLGQVSTYGLYDTLSKAMRSFLDSLHAVHTSRLQCE